MDFSKLNNIQNAKRNLEKKRASEIDAHSYLKRADLLVHQVDSYFIGEPNVFLDSMDVFHTANDFAVFEMEICAAEVMKRFL
jgi:hypothetical protein